MSKKKIVQLIAAIFLILAVILLIPKTKWEDDTSLYGFISLVCGTIGSIISIFIPTTDTFNFTETDWVNYDDRFMLTILAKKHGIGVSPQVQTFLKNEMRYEKVGVSSNHDEKGNITIESNLNFNGKVVVS